MDFKTLLISDGLLSEQQLEMARQSESAEKRLDQVVVDLGLLPEETALSVLAKTLDLSFMELGEQSVDSQLLESFPTKLIYRKNIIPLERVGSTLKVATTDPFDLYTLDELSTLTGLDIEPILATREDIARTIKRYLGVGGDTINQLVEHREDEETGEDYDIDSDDVSELAQTASVVRLVNEFLIEAIELRASDVHLEPQESGLRIRYRIDGVLHPQPLPPETNQFHAAILSRLKIMARLNIAEKRLPQDGRIKITVSGREIDIRVSVIPMLHGEGIVMRLLDKSSMEFNLLGIGMPAKTHSIFQNLIEQPHGIILVTGPTGSGKTTTLYSALNEIRSPSTKIVTIEDPVEYHLEGINQIQVHSKIGLNFSHGLRSILRHDPDIILIGEIRDLETAEIAIQSALTGHLVFSTLHTNDAASAFTRLTDMGVEPFLVTSTIEAVMAQRLVRNICTDCKESYHPDLDSLPQDFPGHDSHESLTLYRGTGCRRCRNTGYRGRTGIFELMRTSSEIQQQTIQRASSNAIQKQACSEGMVTLREDGWLKVLEGITTIDEILRVSKEGSFG
ncbi:MAG: ATPase, T2SS/T4P/T4SS family [Planctomycetota bacterium]|nr:ATPase, T2SS/T4P/T4SS family [Planctomycetota bacterium]